MEFTCHSFRRSVLVCAAAAAEILIGSIVASRAQAAIVTSGNLTGTGTPYNGTDDPWVTSDLIVGNSAAGSMSITGGSTVNNSGSGRIANTTSANGSSVTVDGAGSAWTNTFGLDVGFAGVGTLNITNGASVSSFGGQIGFQPSVNGAVTVDGATWNASSGSLFVGQFGGGSLTITNGGSVSNTHGSIAERQGSSGTVTVGGGSGTSTWNCINELNLGHFGGGTLNINTGGLVIARSLDGGSGTANRLNFNGGTLRIKLSDVTLNTINLLDGGGTIDVPDAGGQNTFTIESNITGPGSLTKIGPQVLLLTGVNTYSGNTTVSGGTLKLSSNGSFASSPIVSLAAGTTLDGSGVTGGANFNGTSFALAPGQMFIGSGTVSGSIGVGAGSSIALAADESVNVSNNVNIDAGTVAVAGGSLSAANIVDNGMLSISAGTLTTAGVLGAGNDGTLGGGTGDGSVVISGGSVSARAVLLGSAAGGTGDLTISAGDLTTNKLAANDVIVDGGTVTVLDELGGPPDPVLDGSMVGGYLRDGAFYVNGGSITTPNVKLGVTAGMTGTYEQSGGALAAGSIFVGSSAGGIGAFRWSGGTLSAQSLEMAGPATLGVSLRGDTLGSGYAQLQVSGNATLTGTLEITRADGFEPQIGASFVIITFGTRSGAFTQVAGMAAGPGKLFRVQYNPNDVTLVVEAPAPGDCDADGDIDLDDYEALTACLEGPGVTGAGCECTDFDDDGDVDLADFAEFQVVFTD